MAKEYRAPTMFNRIVMWVNRLGVGRAETLTTVGRKSGKPRSVPVAPITVDGLEYLVAPYGEVAWVHNVRADPNVTLHSGRRVRHCELVDVTGDAAPVAKAYWDRESFSRPYMDVPENPTVEDFSSVAGRFPVFRIDEKA